MGTNSKLRMVQIVLHWAWDPIGVRGIEEATDEYDIYASKVLDMLEANATDDQIAVYLTGIVRDRIELPVKPERDKDVASMLRQLHTVKN